MQILAIPSSSSIYGMETMTLGFLERLSPEVRCHCLISRWSDGAFARRLDALGIPYTASWLGAFSRQLTPQALRWTADCLRRLPQLYADYLRLTRRLRPDLIYVSTYKQLLLLWPLLRATPAPVVCHMADPPPNVPFQRRSFAVWDRAVDRYIAISESVRRRLAGFGVGEARVSLLFPGIDPAGFPYRPARDGRFTARFGWPAEALLVGMTGQMIAAKGHADLVDAAAELCARRPEARLVLGGPEGGAYADALRARIAARGLDGRAGFTGWLPAARDFYAGVDILAVPSRQPEGFGQVAAEAMASGRAVVAARSGALEEVVEHGESGLLVPPGQPAELARALLLLAEQPALRAELGRRGRRSVERRFDIAAQTRGLEAIFAAAAAGRPRRRGYAHRAHG